MSTYKDTESTEKRKKLKGKGISDFGLQIADF
jgi:hypothetical protein